MCLCGCVVLCGELDGGGCVLHDRFVHAFFPFETCDFLYACHCDCVWVALCGEVDGGVCLILWACA